MKKQRGRELESSNYLAETLRDWRAGKGWPLKKVAVEFGVAEATWSRWEHGARFPAPNLIGPLSQYVQIPVCRFFCPAIYRCPQFAVTTHSPNRTKRTR